MANTPRTTDNLTIETGQAEGAEHGAEMDVEAGEDERTSPVSAGIVARPVTFNRVALICRRTSRPCIGPMGAALPIPTTILLLMAQRSNRCA
jgi:hypothetical protein